MVIIIESPNKIKHIAHYTGAKTLATVGHFKDLPQKEIGVDPDTYEPDFIPTPDKGAETIRKILSAATGEDVVIATDPDREGYAIGTHVYQVIKSKAKSIKRAEIREVTEKAVKEAIARAVPFDKTNKGSYDAFLGRRVGDRVVGYVLSPKAARDLANKHSIGRVQSPALYIVVVREREIQAFKSEKYWDVTAIIVAGGVEFKAEYLNNPVKDKTIAEAIASEISQVGQAVVLSKEGKEQKQGAKPPFSTVDMQAAASASLHFPPEMSMKLAQDLFAAGLITYHRTDTHTLADAWTIPAQQMIRSKYGSAFAPSSPVIYKTKNSQAEAHEAIRPTAVYPVEDIPSLIAKEGLSADHEKLLELVWRRAVSSQMCPALWDTTLAVFEFKGTNNGASFAHQCKANAKVLKFNGFRAVWTYNEADDVVLPSFAVGDTLPSNGGNAEEKNTKPPKRYSEAMLVKELENKGVGRPSTYASIMKVLKTRGYVDVKKGMLHATSMGISLVEWLEKNHPWVVDCGFTAEMETFLDKVEEGKASWKDFIKIVVDRVGGISARKPAEKRFTPLTEKQANLIKKNGDEKALAALEKSDLKACHLWIDKFFKELKSKSK